MRRNNPKEFVSVRVAANALESGLHWTSGPDWIIPLPTRSGLLFPVAPTSGGWGARKEAGAFARSSGGRAKQAYAS